MSYPSIVVMHYSWSNWSRDIVAKRRRKNKRKCGGGAKVGGERRAPARVANFFALTQF